MNIEPFGDKLIVKQIERKEKTIGGLILTDGITEKPSEGIVIKVSKDIKIPVKENDIIIYSKYAGAIIEDNEEEYLILTEEDIYGKRI